MPAIASRPDAPPFSPASPRAALLAEFARVRAWTETLCAPLQPEDYVVQSMPDCSPAKWHLAHTSWFFETFALKAHAPGYRSLHPQYDYLFNSYYNAIGERHCRAKRGLVSRPTVAEVYEYRQYVNAHTGHLLENSSAAQWEALLPIITLGLHHEQQHQELLLTDLKHLFSENPLCPVYQPKMHRPSLQGLPEETALRWLSFPAGLRDIGHEGSESAAGAFAFDNEGPRHPEYVGAFALAARPVTNREWLAFMDDGGYARPEFWLSAGWATVQEQQWNAPLYWWNKPGAGWQAFTLHGMTPLDLDEPVCHVSLYEADAYAQWTGARLPTEAEWETAAAGVPLAGNFAEDGVFHPQAAQGERGQLAQMFGDGWEWTRSQYAPYPGYRAAPGALGEYNGKFMCNQFVLRGGSCATPRSHIRRTYRNFFPPDARWQFTTVRLAKDA